METLLFLRLNSERAVGSRLCVCVSCGEALVSKWWMIKFFLLLSLPFFFSLSPIPYLSLSLFLQFVSTHLSLLPISYVNGLCVLTRV